MKRSLILVAGLFVAGCGGSSGDSDIVNDAVVNPQTTAPGLIAPDPVVTPDITPEPEQPPAPIPVEDPIEPTLPPEPTPEPAPEPTPEPAPEPIPEPTPQPEPIPEPEPTPEPEPEPTPEPEPEPIPEPAPQPDPAPIPEPEPEAQIQGDFQVANADIQEFQPLAGISANITAYTFDGDTPRINMVLANDSGGPIFSATCDITALRDNEIVDDAFVSFASLDAIDPNESANGHGLFFEIPSFGALTAIRVDCDWIDGDGGRQDIVSGPVVVNFIQYTDFFGTPAVELSITNNSTSTINFAVCGVEAKRGDLILDVASLFFESLGEIAPGETSIDEGVFFDLESLNQFDTGSFDLANVNCDYRFVN